MKETKEKELLTDEQLWLLCEEDENKKRFVRDSRDKGVDWDYEQMTWDKWNPKNFK
jgi:hypothetical protein